MNLTSNAIWKVTTPQTSFSRRCQTAFEFVPKCEPVHTNELRRLQSFLKNNNRVCVLTGAGVSTESGIPDYRSAKVGLYARSNRRPVLYKDFCSKESIRKRYWARNYIGWPRFSSVQPNDTHNLLKELESMGKVTCIITQNVDNLHSKAGSKNVIELHGTAYRVICLSCDQKISRHDLQETFKRLNPLMNATSTMIRPDGDVDISQEQIEEFVVPPCANCGGILKPDIVFFGDNVPRTITNAVKNNVHQADSLLVLGTSLSTFSGYRVILQAIEAKKQIAIINIGQSRADEHADFKIEGRCGDVLTKLWTLLDENLYRIS